MRRATATIGAKLLCQVNLSTKQTLIPFSTSTFGRGCGRSGGGGGGIPLPRFDFSTPLLALGQLSGEEPPKPQEPSPLGHGCGHLKPLPPFSPVPLSFDSSVAGHGRGGSAEASSFKTVLPPPLQQQEIQESEKAPFVATCSASRGKGAGSSSFKTVPPLLLQQQDIQELEKVPPIAMVDGSNLPESIASLLPKVGRGQPEKQPEIQRQVNQHARLRARVRLQQKNLSQKRWLWLRLSQT